MAGIVGKDTQWFAKRFLPQDGLVWLFDPDNLDCYKPSGTVYSLQNTTAMTGFNIGSSGNNNNSLNIPTGVTFIQDNRGSKLLLNNNTITFYNDTLTNIVFPITMGIWSHAENGYQGTHNALLLGGGNYQNTLYHSLRIDLAGPSLIYYTTNSDSTLTSISLPNTMTQLGINSAQPLFFTISISGTQQNPQTIMGINNYFFRRTSSNWTNLIEINNLPSPSPSRINGYDNLQWKVSPTFKMGIAFVYNRALTDIELSGIFQATRYRYGV